MRRQRRCDCPLKAEAQVRVGPRAMGSQSVEQQEFERQGGSLPQFKAGPRNALDQIDPKPERVQMSVIAGPRNQNDQGLRERFPEPLVLVSSRHLASRPGWCSAGQARRPTGTTSRLFTTGSGIPPLSATRAVATARGPVEPGAPGRTSTSMVLLVKFRFGSGLQLAAYRLSRHAKVPRMGEATRGRPPRPVR